jgi:hypothetical protein
VADEHRVVQVLVLQQGPHVLDYVINGQIGSQPHQPGWVARHATIDRAIGADFDHHRFHDSDLDRAAGARKPGSALRSREIRMPANGGQGSRS